jgi:hypothetical protein
MLHQSVPSDLLDLQATDATLSDLAPAPVVAGASVAIRFGAWADAEPVVGPDLAAAVERGMRDGELRTSVAQRLGHTANLILLLRLLDGKVKPEMRGHIGRLVEDVFWGEYFGFLLPGSLIGRLGSRTGSTRSTLVHEIDGLRTQILDAPDIESAKQVHARVVTRLTDDPHGPGMAPEDFAVASLFAAHFRTSGVDRVGGSAPCAMVTFLRR